MQAAAYAVTYGAKSTEDPHGSIPTQLSDARAAAERDGRVVAGEYSDEDASAYHGNRGAGLAAAKDHAIRLAAEHGAAELWVQHSDRLAPGDGITADHLAEVYFALRRAGVRLRSVQDDSNLEDAIRVVLIGERNYEDSKRKSAAVASGMKRRRAKGLHIGGPEKLGYRTRRDEYGRPAPGPREILPAEAATVRRIFNDLARGISQKQLARDLNDDGITTKRGGPWWQGTLAKVARDPYYAGLIEVDGELVPGQHEPIISRELFDRVQLIVASRRLNGDGKGGRTSQRPALFTHGHLRCGRCGAAMGIRRKVRRFPNGRVYRWSKYVCTGRERTALASCDMPPVDAEAIEAVMLDELKQQPGVLAARVKDAIAGLFADRDVTSGRILEAEREAADIARKRALVERDYLAGELPAEHYRRFVDMLTAEQEASDAQLARLRARVGELTAALGRDELDVAVHRVMDRIGEVLQGSERIEQARNVIRSAWPTVVLHHDGDRIRLETGPVSEGFTTALSSTIEYDGLPL